MGCCIHEKFKMHMQLHFGTSLFEKQTQESSCFGGVCIVMGVLNTLWVLLQYTRCVFENVVVVVYPCVLAFYMVIEKNGKLLNANTKQM